MQLIPDENLCAAKSETSASAETPFFELHFDLFCVVFCELTAHSFRLLSEDPVKKVDAPLHRQQFMDREWAFFIVFRVSKVLVLLSFYVFGYFKRFLRVFFVFF